MSTLEVEIMDTTLNLAKSSIFNQRETKLSPSFWTLSTDATAKLLILGLFLNTKSQTLELRPTKIPQLSVIPTVQFSTRRKLNTGWTRLPLYLPTKTLTLTLKSMPPGSVIFLLSLSNILSLTSVVAFALTLFEPSLNLFLIVPIDSISLSHFF